MTFVIVYSLAKKESPVIPAVPYWSVKRGQQSVLWLPAVGMLARQMREQPQLVPGKSQQEVRMSFVSEPLNSLLGTEWGQGRCP